MSNEEGQIFDWCKEFLLQKRYQLLSEIVPLRVMPWSQVYQVRTDKGVLYLKHLTKPFAVELNVLKYLQVNHAQMIPKVLVFNHEKRCLLMTDSGVNLRNCLKIDYDAHFPIQALKMCAKIQIDAHLEITKLLALRVPDWRLKQMPMIYEKILTWEDLLIEDGLTKSDFENLWKLRTVFESLCHELAQFNIPDTLEHCDFQDNNILVREDQAVISDWGDSVISHPFFSLLSFLQSAKRNHHILEESKIYHAIKSGYLNEWKDFETKERCLQAFELAKLINPIKFVASFYRISLCPGMNGFGEYKGVIAQSLVDFMVAIQKR